MAAASDSASTIFFEKQLHGEDTLLESRMLRFDLDPDFKKKFMKLGPLVHNMYS